jgi:predicted XRE-type DNA-binding protein
MSQDNKQRGGPIQDYVTPSPDYQQKDRRAERWLNNLKNRFWKRIKMGTAEECWVWQGATSHKYGYLHVMKRRIPAHRLAFIFHNNLRISDALYVCHKCDNPPCCNPDHLFLGTHRDNEDDKVRKGRQLKGERHNLAKLKAKQVEIIRKVYRQEKVSQKELSILCGVGQPQINRIVNNQNWRDQ